MNALIDILLIPLRAVLSWLGRDLYLGRDLPETFLILEKEYGHRKSREMNASVDRNGDPLPWFTYPAIDYLKQFDLTNRRIFEWGAGGSTLFFARKAKSITTVESDPMWHAKIASQRIPTQRMILETDPGKYAQAIAAGNEQFDIIIIDGKQRLRCARAGISHLSPHGLIILDNASWYKKTACFLRDQGLLQVDMSGFAPMNQYVSVTSFFFSRTFDFLPIDGIQPLDPPGGPIADTE